MVTCRPAVAERSKASVCVLDRGRGRSWVQIPAMPNLNHRFSFGDWVDCKKETDSKKNWNDNNNISGSRHVLK